MKWRRNLLPSRETTPMVHSGALLGTAEAAALRPMVVPEIVIHGTEDDEEPSRDNGDRLGSSSDEEEALERSTANKEDSSSPGSSVTNNTLALPVAESWRRRVSRSTFGSSITILLDQTLAKARASSYSGLILALTSGIIFTMYGAILANIKDDISRNTVLTLRGIIQIGLMGIALCVTRHNSRSRQEGQRQIQRKDCAGGKAPPGLEKGLEEDSGYKDSSGASVETPFIEGGKKVVEFENAPKGGETLGRQRRGGFWADNKYRFLMVVCSLMGGARIGSLFVALQMIPLTSVYTILNSSPVVVMILSHFLLKDPLNILKSICCVSFVGGVVLVFLPESSNLKEVHDWSGYFVAFNALLFSALGCVLNKKLTKKYSKHAINFGLGISILAIGLGQLLLVQSDAPLFPSSAKVWVLSILVGVLGTLQQFLLIWALELDTSSRVAMARSIQILTSFLAQLTAGQDFSMGQILGALMVMITIVANSWEKKIIEKCPKVGYAFPLCNSWSSRSAPREASPDAQAENGQAESKKPDPPAAHQVTSASAS